MPSPSVVDVDPAEVGSPPKYLRIPADGKEIPFQNIVLERVSLDEFEI